MPPRKTPVSREEDTKEHSWYVRNRYHAPFNLRLDRHTEKRRIELSGRGQPGDMFPLLESDLKDPILQYNVRLGVIEIIDSEEAEKIAKQQTMNVTRRVHTPLQVLRNAEGKPYNTDAVKVTAEFNQQGVSVTQAYQQMIDGNRRSQSKFIPTGDNDINILLQRDTAARDPKADHPLKVLGDMKVIVEPPQKAQN